MRKRKKNKESLNGSESSKDELKGDEITEETDSFYCWPAPWSLAGLHPELLPALGSFRAPTGWSPSPPSKADGAALGAGVEAAV